MQAYFFSFVSPLIYQELDNKETPGVDKSLGVDHHSLWAKLSLGHALQSPGVNFQEM